MRHTSILHYLRRLVGVPASDAVSDAELLRRFVDQNDEAAFELLLWRHAAMVLHVCRQVLGDEQIAEDAFQATFLVFVRKARAISRREALGSWLYRVALRSALKAKAQMRKQRAVEQELDSQQAAAAAENAEEREQRRIVAEEVHRLPAKFRAAVVACYFEAKSLEEAALHLGWPRGTVASRLARGRELLRRRLLRRGIALPAGILAAAGASATSTASTLLIHGTLQAAKLFAASAATPTRAVALAEGVLQAMCWKRIKLVMVLLLFAGLGGAGATFWAEQPQSEQPPQKAALSAKPSAEADKLTGDMAQSRLNLRKLVLAMQTYAGANKGVFPPPALVNKDGKEVLSWRVLLLPFLGERQLYEQFKLSEAWDSPHNKKLLSKMPAVFAPPGVKTRQPYTTFYQIFVSPKPKDGRKAIEAEGPPGEEVHAAFVQGRPQKLSAFLDGLSQTILIAEAGDAVPWTKPADLPYAADKPLPELGGLFPDVFQAAFADGAVRMMTKNHDLFYLRLLITSNDLQPINLDPVLARTAAADLRRKNRDLAQDLDDAREGILRLQQERDILKGRDSGAKRPQEAESRLKELKEENARLQKELKKLQEEINELHTEIVQLLQKPVEKKAP